MVGTTSGQKANGRVPRTVGELLQDVEVICRTDVQGLDAAGADTAAARSLAAELLECCDKVAKAQRAKPSLSNGQTAKGKLQHSQRHMIVAYAIVVSLTLPYYVCVRYRSWFVDEGFAIYRNPDARGETFVLEVLKHDFWGTSLNPPEGYVTHKSWRPLITLMYAAEWQLCARFGYAGFEMKPMRLLSCLIHSLNAALMLAVLLQARIPLRWAGLAAALFATHPVHIENIVYLVGRADSFSTTFYLLTILFYLRSLRTITLSPLRALWFYAVLAVLNILSGLCKEPGFTALFFVACVETALRCRWGHVLGLLASFAAIAGLRTWYVGGTDAGFGYVDTPIRYQDARLHGSESQALLVRTLSYLFQHGYYAQLLVLPWNQSWDYSYESLPMVTSVADLRLQLIIAAYLSVAALACHGMRLRGKCPSVLMGLGLIVVPFVPMSNLFFLVGTTIGERLLYPLTAGWSLVVGGLGSRCSWRCAWIVAAAGLSVYTINSNIRMSHWESPAVLFLKDAQHWNGSVKVLHAKASELQALGELEEALHYYQKSLDIFDDQAITDYCIARILINLGRFTEAHQRFEKILNGHGIGLHDGNDFLWMTDLGYLLVQLGSDQNGAHYLQEGLNRMPYNCYGWNALGVAQARQGQLEQAHASLTQSLQCDPESAVTWSNLAVLYAYGNAGEQASEALQQALRLNASHPAVAHNLQVLQGLSPHLQPRFELYIPYPGRGGR
ncbi:unnamed protein product [Symbiodinium natans]|uniref:dolichyl-phosphate-mannose--protein mannosyltransferase n=1 Tax=Symbiodinium natans TaxID=878477 RepID=A0A812UGN3_9DINO|nr:unnamed protein product [Symbiodinium natans]